MSADEVYLGDGVFARVDTTGQIRVYTSDGQAETNTIFFEPEVYVALVKWIQHRYPELDLRAQRARERP